MQLRVSQTIKKLLIAYVVVFVVQHLSRYAGFGFASWFALVPVKVLGGMLWQPFTYSFLHADPMHLILNLMVLAFVGSDIESVWGTKRFLVFYSFCTLFAGIFYFFMQLVISTWTPNYIGLPMMGASGGIYGLLLAYGVLFPDREMLFMMIFPMKSKQFVALLAGVEFLQVLVFSAQSGLSAIAHLSGMGAGLLFLWLQAKGIKMDFNKGSSPKKKSNHLKLVQNKPSRDDDDQRGPKTWH